MASRAIRSASEGAIEVPIAKRVKVENSNQQMHRVVLNPADCNLDFNIEQDGLQGHALSMKGFAYCWSGARANVGISGGKYCFGCKIISLQPVEMEDTPSDQQHVGRFGISQGDDAVGSLGESESSFGYGGTGKFSSGKKFSDYGKKFGLGDTIVCAVDLDNKPSALIGFSKNGEWLGTAKHFDAGPTGRGITNSSPRKSAWETAFFPHILLKNVVVQVQFSLEQGLVPPQGYKPWSCAVEDGNAVIGPVFASPKDCEVLMMVGLPASGKSTWAEKWAKDHPEKRYVLLGTNLALDQMKVPGLLRKHNYGERFDCLMDRATDIFNTLLSRASNTPRNYILDQTNVYKNARKRKLKAFFNYRKVAVVIFPKPEELKRRAAQRFKEMGKEVPAEAVNEMLANYVLPTSKNSPGSDELFDEVIFPELDKQESQRYLIEMKNDLKFPSSSKLREYSPYTQEGSFQSSRIPSTEERGSVGNTDTHSYHSPYQHPIQEFQSPPQVRTGYVGGESYGRHNVSPTSYSSGYSRSGEYGRPDVDVSPGVAHSGYSGGGVHDQRIAFPPASTSSGYPTSDFHVTLTSSTAGFSSRLPTSIQRIPVGDAYGKTRDYDGRRSTPTQDPYGVYGGDIQDRLDYDTPSSSFLYAGSGTRLDGPKPPYQSFQYQSTPPGSGRLSYDTPRSSFSYAGSGTLSDPKPPYGSFEDHRTPPVYDTLSYDTPRSSFSYASSSGAHLGDPVPAHHSFQDHRTPDYRSNYRATDGPPPPYMFRPQRPGSFALPGSDYSSPHPSYTQAPGSRYH